MKRKWYEADEAGCFSVSVDRSTYMTGISINDLLSQPASESASDVPTNDQRAKGNQVQAPFSFLSTDHPPGYVTPWESPIVPEFGSVDHASRSQNNFDSFSSVGDVHLRSLSDEFPSLPSGPANHDTISASFPTLARDQTDIQGQSLGTSRDFLREPTCEESRVHLHASLFAEQEEPSIPTLDTADTAFDCVQSGKYEVCLGMIHTDKIKITQSIPRREIGQPVDVLLKFHAEITTVYFKDSSQYAGILDQWTAQVVNKLIQNFRVNLSTTLISQATKVTRHTAPKNHCDELYIVVYGFNNDGEAIGDLLSQNNTYLQHPRVYDHTVIYNNPQYLVKPGCKLEAPDDSAAVSTTALSTERKKVVLTKDQVVQVFDNAHGPQIYCEVPVSERLVTKLKSHQKKALAMMLEKERGQFEGNEFGSMWDCGPTENGHPRYKNIVTGSVRDKRPQMCLGGLLADEMGLGKTLTTLALVASSLDGLDQTATQDTMDILKSGLESKCRTTLIVTPLSTLSTWDEQIMRHFKSDSIRVSLYHGAGRKGDALKSVNQDIVITTYGTLTAEWSEQSQGSITKPDMLHSSSWFRVVLDEAHVIRNHSTKQYRAANALKAEHRWCLSGTPIQNRVEDIGALFSFLRLAPFDNRHTFNTYISNPIKIGNKVGMERLRLIINSMALRRTKNCVGDELQLPRRVNQEVWIKLDSEERNLYDMFRKGSLEVVDTMAHGTSKVKSFNTVLKAILRLRQICNHGSNLLSSEALRTIGKTHDPSSDNTSIKGVETCEGCDTALTDHAADEDGSIQSGCMLHILCSPCLLRGQEGCDPKGLACPLCTGTGTGAAALEEYSDEGQTPSSMGTNESVRPSSKVQALLQNLNAFRAESSDIPIKSVIFSAWTKMLDLIQVALQSEGFDFVRIDGKKSDKQRREALKRFRTDRTCTILMATIGSAGVGLDLTAACRVHLLEPQWNPAAEEQALDRVHRMGQTREVIALRYIVDKSIENYVMWYQKRKLELIEHSLGASSSKADLIRKRLEDLKSFLS